MVNPVFDGMADALFGSLKETASAILTILPAPEGAPPSTMTVDLIFNARHVDVDYRGVPFGEARPVAWVRADAFHACDKPKYGDELTIGEVDYMVMEAKFDGLQLWQLTLGEK